MSDTGRHNADLLRGSDLGRYYASLCAPDSLRAPLQALYAFDIETLGVRERISEPMPGEIRLQWWSDTLEGLYRGHKSGNPVADGLGGAIAVGKLPHSAFARLLHVRQFDLYDDPFATMNDLEGHFGETFSAVIQMACLVLARGRETGSAAAAGYGGVAAGIVWVLRNLGRNAARGQPFLPIELLARHGVNPESLRKGRADDALVSALGELHARAHEHLDRASEAAGALPGETRPAFAHLAVARAELNALARIPRQPFARGHAVLPFSQFVRVYMAARQGF